MTYEDQWRTLAARIHGLTQAGLLWAQFLQVKSEDTYGTWRRFREQAASILTAVESFGQGSLDSLPQTAVAPIRDLAENLKDLKTASTDPVDSNMARVKYVLVRLAAFESEMSFLLADVQQAIRKRSERAFDHLKRSIIADEELRTKWQRAFEEGELTCEQLGHIHLLLHGIFSFKANAKGGRTDLIFQEPIEDLAGVKRYAEGFVLTEWKLAKSLSDAENKFREARKQATLYSGGILAGTELSGYRYAVVVSEKCVDLPGDERENEVVYRHINIAVNPETPSKVARQRARLG